MAARRPSTHERGRATHWDLDAYTSAGQVWDLDAYTSAGQVGCGEGCEPLPHHVVVHDDGSSP